MIITLLLVALLLTLIGVVSSSILNTYEEKGRPFECGFLGYEERRSPFRVHFFIVALIFLIFDVELILIFPFLPALSYQADLTMCLIIRVFIVILLLGLLIEWEKSILEWQT